MDLIPMNKITHLTDNEFMICYVNGQLNSLDIPAREYLERKDIIKEQMEMRIEDGFDPFKEMMAMDIPNVEKEDNFRAHLILYAEEEGTMPQFVVCDSEEMAKEMVKEFQKTGEIEIPDFFRGGRMTKKNVLTVAHTITQGMWKRRGNKTIYK